MSLDEFHRVVEESTGLSYEEMTTTPLGEISALLRSRNGTELSYSDIFLTPRNPNYLLDPMINRIRSNISFKLTLYSLGESIRESYGEEMGKFRKAG